MGKSILRRLGFHQSVFSIAIIFGYIFFSHIAEVWAKEPEWYSYPDSLYKKEHFLVGKDYDNNADKAIRKENARKGAKADILQQISQSIAVERYRETKAVSNEITTDVLITKTSYEASLSDVRGVSIKKEKDDPLNNTSYALAILPKKEGREIHLEALERNRRELDSFYTKATEASNNGELEKARDMYREVETRRRKHEEFVDILDCLQASGLIYEKLKENVPKTADIRATKDSLNSLIQNQSTKSRWMEKIEEAVSALAQQLEPLKRIILIPFNYEKIGISTSHPDSLTKLVGEGLKGKGYSVTIAESDTLSRLQEDSGFVISGTYLARRDSVLLSVLAKDARTLQTEAATTVDFLRKQAEAMGLDFELHNKEHLFRFQGKSKLIRDKQQVPLLAQYFAFIRIFGSCITN